MEANKSPRNQRNKPMRTATRTTLNRKALYETLKRYKQFKAAFSGGEFCPYSKLPSKENVNRSSLNKKLFAKECRLKKQKLQMLSALINRDPPHGDLSLTKKYQTVSLW